VPGSTNDALSPSELGTRKGRRVSNIRVIECEGLSDETDCLEVTTVGSRLPGTQTDLQRELAVDLAKQRSCALEAVDLRRATEGAPLMREPSSSTQIRVVDLESILPRMRRENGGHRALRGRVDIGNPSLDLIGEVKK
jgi:hypothetical protein